MEDFKEIDSYLENLGIEETKSTGISEYSYGNFPSFSEAPKNKISKTVRKKAIYGDGALIKAITDFPLCFVTQKNGLLTTKNEKEFNENILSFLDSGTLLTVLEEGIVTVHEKATKDKVDFRFIKALTMFDRETYMLESNRVINKEEPIILFVLFDLVEKQFCKDNFFEEIIPSKYIKSSKFVEVDYSDILILD